MKTDKLQLLEAGFTHDQVTEIQYGEEEGLNVSVYADKQYLAIQMRQIRYGLEEHLDVSAYANPKYDWFQMEEIRKGLIGKLPIEKYASPDITYDKMKQIREGLCDGIDLSPFKHLEAGVLKELRLALKKNIKIVPYINEGYNTEQLEAIREALEKNLPIDAYLDKAFRGVALREIFIGLEHGLDVSVYKNPRYCWQQMREIRYGLEHRIDVSKYANHYYTHEQMREIRLGLEAGLDVSYFSSLMYTAADMHARRLALLEHPSLAVEAQAEDTSDEEEELVRITLEEENTKAFVDIPDIPADKLRIEMVRALRRKGITVGVKYDVIDRLIEGKELKRHILVATGTMPVDGQDGYYEYFFRTQVSHTPKQTEDGNVDYRNVDWFEQVKENQKLAVYHPATTGKNGVTVFGKEIPARKGKEQCILTGKGFHRLDDTITYVADLDGVVSFSEKRDNQNVATEIRVDVTKLLAVEAVTLATGDIHFDGCVSVRANVGSGAAVYATGDVYVGGFVEAGKIFSDGNIVIRQGVNASGNGEIHARGDVTGCFFEAATIEAGGSIYGDYFMNCDMTAKEKIYAMGKKGSIAGGTAWAGGGAQVDHLGNQAGIATYFKLGVSDMLLDEEQKLDKAMNDVEVELDALNKAHEDYERKFSPEIRNSSQLFIKIANAIYTKELEMKKLKLKKQDIELRRKKEAVVHAQVDLKLYENVTFEIDRVRWKTTSRCGAVRVQKVKNQIMLFSNRTK